MRKIIIHNHLPKTRDERVRDGENFNITASMKEGANNVSKSITLAAQNIEMAKTAAINWWRKKGFADISVTKAEPNA
jgi:hypothetical protein